MKVYLLDLLRALPEARRSTITLLTTQSNASLFDSLDGYSTVTLPWSVRRRPVRVLTQQFMVPIVAMQGGIDVLFEPVDTAAILSPVPIVTSLHSGPINMEANQMGGIRSLYNRLFLQSTAWRSKRLIAISEFVKQSLVDVLGVNEDRVRVVHHGGGIVEEARNRGWTSSEEKRTGGILFVSTLYPHKNPDQLIRAYARLENRQSELPPLIIVGGDTDGENPTEERGTERDRLSRLADHLGVGEQVEFPGRISDEELLDLFATSRLMVYPSSLEGFGIPAVEAMQAGLPLVASNRTSIPEIVGEGGILIDPNDVEAMADRMEEVLFNDEVRHRLIGAGRKRGEKFSWNRAGEETLQVLKEAASI
ncbi:glycosyltransferase involved in cell wall biosynthesis [Salinibacter ruber]|uniref:glycosyltransferase family 4 protein n=1 Tax=Salinibacter ruber TaxID=146919 RepID=UPI002167B313|nr:glycosyltransferase involved in cell wall biosynthesis [Salinibacter ruber]MCS4116734.1 glycosyltransferase involved in cell wall biosynthesis [Salinibacter ruber]MCS4152847.1 glycosyltransferase involved in cell wall biosynthesis [Salinibacter ruber]MCS4168660.1 glycosyltransferase involved in cell wall biosynthesis [Salinibacter ruber]